MAKPAKASPAGPAKPAPATSKPAPRATAKPPAASAPPKPAASRKPAAAKAATRAATPAPAPDKPRRASAAPKIAAATPAEKPARRRAAKPPAAPASARVTATPRSRGAKPAAPAAKPPASPRPARKTRPPKVTPDRLEQLVQAAAKSLEDDKAEDILILDVTGRADYADRLIIATGLVDRQIQAMASHLVESLEKAGLRLKRDAIQASDDWVLIDALDLVIHLFKPEARALYGLERMWGPDSPSPDAAGTTP